MPEPGEEQGNPTLAELRANLSALAIDLLVTVGLFSAVIDNYPEEVRENFKEKIAEFCAVIDQETKEFYDFGEAYD